MTNHPIPYDQLIAFAAGELDAQTSADTASHVATCAECTATVADYRSVREILLTDDSRLPLPAVIAQAQAIFSQQRAAMPRVQPLARLRFSLTPLLASLVLALVLLSGGALVVAAQDAPPGSALYPARMIVQGMQESISNAWKALGAPESPFPTATPTPMPSTPTPKIAPTPIPSETPSVLPAQLNPVSPEMSPGQVLTPPGQLLTPPGQLWTPPGQVLTPPGQLLTPPGQALTPPGQLLTPPGQVLTPPGQQQNPPGQDGNPPGQQQNPPGQGGNPPGQQRNPPGQGGNPPGQPTKKP